MTHTDHIARQQSVLERLFDILMQDPNVIGISATGSYAHGANDAFSDLDIGCYLRDEARSARAEIHERVGDIAPLLCKLWLYDLHGLYLYDNGVRLDLDYYEPSHLQRADLTIERILYDPQGILARTKPTAAPPELPVDPYWESQEGNMLDWLFWMYRQVYCWARRGAQGGPKAFDKLSNCMGSLAQIRDTLVRMRLWTQDACYYVDRADADFARRIAATYPHLEADEVLAATRLLLAEYEAVGPDYCRKRGRSFPTGKVATMWRLFDEWDELR